MEFEKLKEFGLFDNVTPEYERLSFQKRIYEGIIEVKGDRQELHEIRKSIKSHFAEYPTLRKKGLTESQENELIQAIDNIINT